MGKLLDMMDTKKFWFEKGHTPWNKSKTLTKKHKDNIGSSMKGKPSAMKGRTKESGLYPENSGFRKGHPHYTTKGDFKKGEGMGRNNVMFGKVVFSHKRYYYKGIWMRSSWEVAYAKYLDKNNLKWEYERDTFNLKNTTYTPDFYLPETNQYVEIKGYMHSEAYLKIKEFILNNPDINYVIIRRKDLKKVGVL